MYVPEFLKLRTTPVQSLRSLRPRIKFSIFSKPRHVKFHSIMFEMSVIYSLILAIILVIFSGVVYAILSSTLYDELDNEVRLKAVEISANIRTYLEFKSGDPSALNYAVEKTLASQDQTLRRWWYIGFERSWFQRLDEQNLSNDFINFVSPDKISLMHSKNMSPQLLDQFMLNTILIDGQPRLSHISNKTHNLRVINYPFISSDGKHYILQVGISITPVIQLIQNWMNGVFLSIPILLILTSFIGRILASRILKPVGKISRIADTISSEDLSKRVEKENFYEEMDSLVNSVNGMMDRLEKSFNHIQNFSSHMAHELKTPLTIMRGETELALLAQRTPTEYQKALKIILGEITTMLKIIEDLLFLTKTDHHPGVFKFEQINFVDYFQEIYEQTKLLATPKSIQVGLDIAPHNNKIFIKADPLHLRRLFLNLLDNAIKFSPAESKIDLRVERGEQELSVFIEDRGVGIPADEVSKIFDRFYTLDQHGSGNGLGLSISQSIVKAHGGRIDVSSEPQQGSTFTVILPTL